MPRFIPPKLEDIGLREYLDKTKDQHEGRGYAEFADMLGKGINKSNIGRMFKVERRTIARWIELMETPDANK